MDLALPFLILELQLQQHCGSADGSDNHNGQRAEKRFPVGECDQHGQDAA